VPLVAYGSTIIDKQTSHEKNLAMPTQASAEQETNLR